MKVVEFRTAEELLGLQCVWNSLLSQSASNTIFLTWEWVTSWWSSYGEPAELYILAAYSEDGQLRGLAPMRRRTLRAFGQSVPALAFVGDGSNDSDYLDLIIARGYEQEVTNAFRVRWMEELRGGTVLSLNEVPATSVNYPLWKELAKAPGIITEESSVACGTVVLPDSWEKFLSELKPRFRTKVRSILRESESRSELQWGFCQTRDEVEAMLPVLFDLHTRRWAQASKPGVFTGEQKRSFYGALSIALLERDWLRFSWLKWRDRVLACQYGFVHNSSYFQLQEGYEPDAEHLNAGIALRAWSIREFIGSGVREYDFMAGMGRHKSDWGAQIKNSQRMLIAHATIRNRLFCEGPKWEIRTRESIKALLPDRLVAARTALLRRRQEVAFGQGPAKSAVESRRTDWVRRVAAKCYVESSLPALAGALRRRVQVSIGTNGLLPKASLHRRREPSARILCFHRINEDGDPFFPAVSTALFEKVMRFLARHHKVVSLHEALNHLDGGSHENVLAITFDDGYQDNYLQAFPILHRYGLPATVFLTTGSLDSRDALWFEELAGALKHTAKESIDITIDFPRRLPLRSVADRLEANGRLFRLLRSLTDSERQLHLTEILRNLGYERGARRDQMLTWEQVRLMKAGGIDFGGHTVNHPFLSKITPDRVSWEVSECKRRIEDELQQPVEHFAYPNGREEDFAQNNKELVRAAGYKAAVTTIWGVNYLSTDRMELKRSGPWEDDPNLFSWKLDWYQMVND